MTRNYPFRYDCRSQSDVIALSDALKKWLTSLINSSECLDEAKRRVHADPASNRSWNYCWLVLAKVHTDGLIPTYARKQAVRPEMWGGRAPQAEDVEKLVEAFVREWSAALAQMLRHWEEAPIR